MLSIINSGWNALLAMEVGNCLFPVGVVTVRVWSIVMTATASVKSAVMIAMVKGKRNVPGVGGKAGKSVQIATVKATSNVHGAGVMA